MSEQTFLAEAMQLFKSTSIDSAKPHIQSFEVDDGKGGKVQVPIAFVPAGNGEVVTIPLLDKLSTGQDWARRSRLSMADGPDRREGTATLQTIDSFVAHAKRFKAVNSAVWADSKGRRLVSVLDYHLEGATSAARWGKHRGEYVAPLSDAWRAWGGVDGLELTQDEFADLLDSRDMDLTGGGMSDGRNSPDPTFLLNLAQNLEVHSSSKAKRERDPKTGRLKVTFSEESGVVGDVTIPPRFLLCIPVFEDGDDGDSVEVRLKVTVDEGKAVFHVAIHDAANILRGAFVRLCDFVKNETGLPVFVGTPETT